MSPRHASLAVVASAATALALAACAPRDDSLYRQIDEGGVPQSIHGVEAVQPVDDAGAARQVRDAQRTEQEAGGLQRRLQREDQNND